MLGVVNAPIAHVATLIFRYCNIRRAAKGGGNQAVVNSVEDDHCKASATNRKLAEVCTARLAPEVASYYLGTAAAHEAEADDLAMLAAFYRFGGVAS